MKVPDNTAKIPDPNGAHHLLRGAPRFRSRKNSSSEPAGSKMHMSSASASPRVPLTAILRAMPSSQLAVLAVICAYAILFIYRTSFLIDGTRYFCLFDDDMISMRYAANFAHGYGLVWNPGHERVLGFTNLLWVLYMSIVHLLPISLAKVSVFIQATNGLLLAINLIFVVAICNELFPGQSRIALVAMVLTALDGPLNNWALQGTEVGVLALGLTLSTWLALRTIEAKGPALKLYVVLGILTLFRIDMAVAAGTILLALIAIEPQKWKEHLLLGGAIVACFLRGPARIQSVVLWPRTSDYLLSQNDRLSAARKDPTRLLCKYRLPASVNSAATCGPCAPGAPQYRPWRLAHRRGRWRAVGL